MNDHVVENECPQKMEKMNAQDEKLMSKCIMNDHVVKMNVPKNVKMNDRAEK